MAKKDEIRKITLKINYKNKNPLNFSKIKLSSDDQAIYDVALAIFALQDASLDGIFKVVEKEICDS